MPGSTCVSNCWQYGHWSSMYATSVTGARVEPRVIPRCGMPLNMAFTRADPGSPSAVEVTRLGRVPAEGKTRLERLDRVVALEPRELCSIAASPTTPASTMMAAFRADLPRTAAGRRERVGVVSPG